MAPCVSCTDSRLGGEVGRGGGEVQCELLETGRLERNDTLAADPRLQVRRPLLLAFLHPPVCSLHFQPFQSLQQVLFPLWLNSSPQAFLRASVRYAGHSTIPQGLGMWRVCCREMVCSWLQVRCVMSVLMPVFAVRSNYGCASWWWLNGNRLLLCDEAVIGIGF